MTMQVAQVVTNAAVVALATLVVTWMLRDGFRTLEARIDRFEQSVERRFERNDADHALMRQQFDRWFEVNQAEHVVDRTEHASLRTELLALRSDLTQVALAVGARTRNPS